MAKIKPTLKDPISPQSEKFEKDFKKTMVRTAPDANLNEVNSMLSEVEQSLKKKIFSLAKMESLVFSDPKLSAVYEEMSQDGEEKYGYHYNETIQNIIFNDYVLNSPTYIQKYKMAIPKEKKRRDKSGINQLKKAGEKKMSATGTKLAEPKEIDEINNSDTEKTTVAFLIHPEHPEVYAYFPDESYDTQGRYKTGYAHIGQHSAIDPKYAAESTEASPEEYQELKFELEGQGYNLEILNGLSESTSAGSAGGAAGYVGYAGPAAFSSKGNLSGDFEGKKKKKKVDPEAKPISTGFALHETNYITDPSGFEKYIKTLNEESDANFISRNGSNTYGNVDNMNPENQKIIKKDIQSGKMDTNHNIKDSIALQEKAKSKAQQRFFGMVNAVKKGELSPDKVGGKVVKAAHDMTDKDVDDFASTKHKGLPKKISEDNDSFMKIWNEIQPIPQGADFRKQNGEPLLLFYDGNPEATAWAQDVSKKYGIQAHNTNNIKEDMQTMIQNNGTSVSNKSQATGDMSSEVPMGTQQTGGLNEELTLLKEINKELEAFSIHHNKLKLMAENKKTPSMVQGDRLRSENPKNFKKDMQNSDTKEIIDVEKELQWKDQQTDVGDDSQKLGADIEKQEIKVGDMKGDEALKNVGDSSNEDGDEIPKRNLTSKEQEEVDLYRNGQHSLVYDNEPDKRFVERQKADQGEFFKMGEKQKEFKAGAPMYDKDTQPIDDGIKKVQFDRNVKQKGDKVAWGERMGLGSNVKLAESMITGRYIDILDKRRLMEFRMNEVSEIKTVDEDKLMKLNFEGLGNTYLNKTVDKKVVVNEGVVNIMENHQFYTDGKAVFVMKNPVEILNEGEIKKEKPVMNEQMDKMKHLLGYKPNSFINTQNVKKNRGF